MSSSAPTTQEPPPGPPPPPPSSTPPTPPQKSNYLPASPVSPPSPATPPNKNGHDQAAPVSGNDRRAMRDLAQQLSGASVVTPTSSFSAELQDTPMNDVPDAAPPTLSRSETPSPEPRTQPPQQPPAPAPAQALGGVPMVRKRSGLQRQSSTLLEQVQEREERLRIWQQQLQERLLNSGSTDNINNNMANSATVGTRPEPAIMDGNQSPKRKLDEMNANAIPTGNEDDGEEPRGRSLTRLNLANTNSHKRSKIFMDKGLQTKAYRQRGKKIYIYMLVRNFAKSRCYHLENTKSLHLQAFHSGDCRVKFRKVSNTDFQNVMEGIESLYDTEGPEAELALTARIEFEIPSASKDADKPDGLLKISFVNDTHRCIGRRITKELCAKLSGSMGYVDPSVKQPKGSVYVLDSRTAEGEEMYIDRGFWVKDSIFKFFVVPDGALMQKKQKRPFLIVDVLTAPSYSCLIERAATYILGSNGGMGKGGIGMCIIICLFNNVPDDKLEKGVYTHASAYVFERDKSANYNIINTFKAVPVFPDYDASAEPIVIKTADILRKREGQGQLVSFPETVEVKWEELRDWVAVSFEQTGQPKTGGFFYETVYEFDQIMRY